VHGRFRAGIGEAHHIHTRAHGDHLVGHLQHLFRAHGKRLAVLDGRDNGCVHTIVGVAQYGRAVAHAVVDVAVAVHIPNVGAFAALDIARIVRPPKAEVGRNAERKFAGGALMNSAGFA